MHGYKWPINCTRTRTTRLVRAVICTSSPVCAVLNQDIVEEQRMRGRLISKVGRVCKVRPEAIPVDRTLHYIVHNVHRPFHTRAAGVIV